MNKLFCHQNGSNEDFVFMKKEHQLSELVIRAECSIRNASPLSLLSWTNNSLGLTVH